MKADLRSRMDLWKLIRGCFWDFSSAQRCCKFQPQARSSHPVQTISWQVLHSPAGWLLIFILLSNNYIHLYTIQLFPAFRNTSPGPHSSLPLHPQTVVQLLTCTRHCDGLQKISFIPETKKWQLNFLPVWFWCAVARSPPDSAFLCVRVEEKRIKCNYF